MLADIAMSIRAITILTIIRWTIILIIHSIILVHHFRHSMDQQNVPLCPHAGYLAIFHHHHHHQPVISTFRISHITNSMMIIILMKQKNAIKGAVNNTVQRPLNPVNPVNPTNPPYYNGNNHQNYDPNRNDRYTPSPNSGNSGNSGQNFNSNGSSSFRPFASN